MKKLQCRVCGGALVMDASWDFAECEQCGMKYTKESIQKMLDLPIADEQNAGADAMLLTAKRQMDTGDYAGAKNTYQKILDRIDPLSTDAWWGLLQCRFHFTDLFLSGQLVKSDMIFLFGGKPEWDMSAFEDNLKSAVLRASPEQKERYEREYSAFIEELPEKRRKSEESKGKEQLEYDIENARLELSRLQALQAERKASLDAVKRRKKFRRLWLILAVFATLSSIYFMYSMVKNVRSFGAFLFEFIVSVFIMVAFWMLFNYYKSDDLKKSRIAYLTSSSSEIVKQIGAVETRLQELKQRLDQLR